MLQTLLTLKHPSWEAMKIIADPYRTHQAIMSAYPLKPGPLFRVSPLPDDSGYQVLIQLPNGAPQPQTDFSDLFRTSVDNQTRTCATDLRPGGLYWFDLTANPTRRSNATGKRTGIIKAEEQTAWLCRKLERAAQLDVCRVVESHETRALKQDMVISLWKARFEGVLRVCDPERMAGLLSAGIGSAKGMGFGLLTLHPLQS